MAKVYITEFAYEGQDKGAKSIPMPLEPPLAEQVVAISGSSAQSSAFNPGTAYVRVEVDSTCSIVFGTNPTATTNNRRMAANTTEYSSVPPGQGFKLAVITNT